MQQLQKKKKKNRDWMWIETNKKSTFSFSELELAQFYIFSKLSETTHYFVNIFASLQT